MVWYETYLLTRATLSYTIRAACLIHFVHSNIYELKSTHGESMLPTLNTKDDYVHTLKSYKNGKGVQMGDLVVLLKPTDPDQRVCKRISGMPGDIIIIDPSNESLGDNVDPRKNQASFDRYIVVPEGHVWVTGDNLSHSLDSRTYSVLPMGLIKGKIFAANDWNDSYKTFFGFRWLPNDFDQPIMQQKKNDNDNDNE